MSSNSVCRLAYLVIFLFRTSSNILFLTALGIFFEKRSITLIEFEKSTNKASIESAEVPERTPIYKSDFGIKFEE